MRGWGGYVPERVVTNDELARDMDTSDDWIRSRTGIRQRHVAAPGEFTSDLAVAAARPALARAGLTAADVDLIVCATSTPDHTFPATATAVQRKLGCPVGIAFDLQAVCAGFPYALTVADQFLRLGQARTALVIGAETFSRLMDWSDRGTSVLFGDGAGALVLAAEPATAEPAPRGVLASHLAADGRHYDDLYVDGGPSTTGTTGHLRMNGQEVYRHAVAALAASVTEVLRRAGLTLDEVAWIAPHQANKRILDAVAKRLGVAAERVLVTVDRHANTSAASIPLALDLAAADGRLRRGDLVVATAMGGGFTWGAVALRW
ncbi:MAG: beta-ketoacyl-ACP synthase III [Alphaproteobacteria bacterium]|nr:beta-ketoacyl-ACP synthase III [Alphaproteobacteria bacterium]